MFEGLLDCLKLQVGSEDAVTVLLTQGGEVILVVVVMETGRLYVLNTIFPVDT